MQIITDISQNIQSNMVIVFDLTLSMLSIRYDTFYDECIKTVNEYARMLSHFHSLCHNAISCELKSVILGKILSEI